MAEQLEMHEAVIRVFLKDHPEHIQGTSYRMLGRRRELCLDTPTLKAFAQWTIRTNRGDAAKAQAFLTWLGSREFDKAVSDAISKAKGNSNAD